VPHGPPAASLDPFSVAGPMARDVADVALMLDAYTGQRAADPLTFDPVEDFQRAAQQATAPKRVAWSADLGVCQVDRELAEICAAATRRFADLGATVEEAHPDCAGAREVFQTFRAHHMASGRGALLQQHRDKMKPEVIWNIEAGLKLSSEDLRRAFQMQGALFQRFAAFFERYDILALPTAQAHAFPVEQRYVDTINGVKLETYVDWLLITSVITMTGCPVLSLPCGFTKAGMPVGLQLVGKPRGEAALLGAAAALERVLGISDRVPIDPVIRH
jgi:amidase